MRVIGGILEGVRLRVLRLEEMSKPVTKAGRTSSARCTGLHSTCGAYGAACIFENLCYRPQETVM